MSRAKYSTSLTAANCAIPTRKQVGRYIAWLEEHPHARAYVFPASKSGKREGDSARNEIEAWAKARGREVIEVSLDDYQPGLPVDENEVKVAA